MFHVGVGIKNVEYSEENLRELKRWESKFTNDPLVFDANCLDTSARRLNVSLPSPMCEVKLFRDYGGLLEGVPFDILPAQRGCRLILLGLPRDRCVQDMIRLHETEMQYYSELKRSYEEVTFDRSVLFVFKEQRFADRFFRDWHIQFFDLNSTSGPICYLAFIDKLFVMQAESEEFRSLLPVGSKQIPSCPLCIERIDVNVSGIITSRRGWLSTGAVSSKSCVACSNLSNPFVNCTSCTAGSFFPSGLWLCLLCGKAGCGRYDKGHAESHSRRTGHRLSLEISTGRIWDYVSDRFVHRRMVCSQGSGPILDLPERIDSSSLPAHPQVSFDEDIIELDKTMSEQLRYERSKYEEACTQLKVLGKSRADCEEEVLHREEAQEREMMESLEKKRIAYSLAEQEVRILRSVLNEKEMKLENSRRNNLEISKKINREKNKRDTEFSEIPQPKLDELERLLNKVDALRLKVCSI